MTVANHEGLDEAYVEHMKQESKVKMLDLSKEPAASLSEKGKESLVIHHLREQQKAANKNWKKKE